MWPTSLKLVMTGFEPIIAKNVQKINFKFTMISIFTTLFICTTLPTGHEFEAKLCYGIT